MAAFDPGQGVAELQVVVLEKVETASRQVKASRDANPGIAVGRVLGHVDSQVRGRDRLAKVKRGGGTQKGDDSLVHERRSERVRVVQSDAVGFGGPLGAVVTGNIATGKSCAAGIVVHENMAEQSVLGADIQVNSPQVHVVIHGVAAQRHNASRGTFWHELEQILGRRGDAAWIDNIVGHARGAGGGQKGRAGIGIRRVAQHRARQ